MTLHFATVIVSQCQFKSFHCVEGDSRGRRRQIADEMRRALQKDGGGSAHRERQDPRLVRYQGDSNSSTSCAWGGDPL